MTMSFDSFSGNAVILRRPRRVSFHDGRLIINDLTTEEAFALLGSKAPAADANPPMEAQKEAAGKVVEELRPTAEAAGEEVVKDRKRQKPEPKEEPALAEPELVEEEAEVVEEEAEVEIPKVKNLRELLQHLKDQGANEPDEFVEGCLKLKGKLPFLDRMNALESRVRKAVGILGLGAE